MYALIALGNIRMNEAYLDVHFDHSFSNESRSKKGPERDKEMATGNSSQVKQRIWYLDETKLH